MQKNKSAIIFGSNGYIGKHLLQHLKTNDFDIFAYGINEPSKIKDYSFFKINLLDRQSIDSINWNVDYVFFFAGMTGTKNSFEDYDNFINLNETAFLNVLDAIKNSSFCPRVIFPSTRLVYQGDEKPLKEDASLLPKTIYAVNKIACEHYLAIYQNMFDIPFSIFRICIPYGNLLSGDYSFGTIGNLTNSLKNDGEIFLFGHGHVRRTFTHVEDLINQIIITTQKEGSKNQIFNIFGENYSLMEVSTMLCNKFGGKINLIPWPADDQKLESGSTIFDASKIIKLSKYKMKYSMSDWIDSLDL
jgi:UDP-glucose 4-epimerase